MKKVFSNPRNVFLEEGRCDGVLCRYCIFGKKQQCYSSWLKRISDFDEAHRSRFDHKHDELVVYICLTFFRVKSRRVRQRLTEDMHNNRTLGHKASCHKSFQARLQLLLSRPLDSALMHSINKDVSPIAIDTMAFGLPIRHGRTLPFLRNDTEYGKLFFCVTGCFPRHSQNEPNDSPLQICTAEQMHFSNAKKNQTTCSFQIGPNNPTRENLSLNRLFSQIGQ